MYISTITLLLCIAGLLASLCLIGALLARVLDNTPEVTFKQIQSTDFMLCRKMRKFGMPEETIQKVIRYYDLDYKQEDLE
jgi:hypothetical protein